MKELTALQEDMIERLSERGAFFVAESAQCSWEHGHEAVFDWRTPSKGIRKLLARCNRQAMRNQRRSCQEGKRPYEPIRVN